MQIIRHRINSTADLATVDPGHGVEVDLRDLGNRLILSHDPFSEGQDFSEFLSHYRHGSLILNVKSERIEHRVLEEIQRAASVRSYFFLDCSFPMIRNLISKGERNIAVRFSEFEPIESVLSLAGEIHWVWVDCFTRMPLDARSYHAMKEAGFKLCGVSPELQNRPKSSIPAYRQDLGSFPLDAVCTKYPEMWLDPC